MKIGCPNCGQHYDVEAGALDRFYRCTECGEIFQGINAKPVKARRYRRKTKKADGPDADSSAVSRPAAETSTVPALGREPEERPLDAPESTVDDHVDGANASGGAAVNISAVPDSTEGRQSSLLPVLVLALLLIAFAILCYQSVRIARLDTANRKLAARVERLAGDLDALKSAPGK